uniref:Anion exchange protein n=1 Tax=Sinocyclocheilus grahami TaxID=75366 RepID=A0A672LYC8_SINGR
HILREEDEPTPTLFTEMDTLQHEGGEMEWKESARWVKFEEKVEEGGERWSKPHVSTLSLHSLFELRTCLQTGCILLDLEGYSLPQIVDDIIEKQVQEGLIAPEIREKISFVLLRKHRHQTKKPIHRSLADIGKSSPSSECPLSYLSHSQWYSQNSLDAEASNVLIGEVDFLDKPFVAFVRLAQAATLGGLTEVPVPTRFLFVLLGPNGKTKSYNEIGRAMATLMVDDLFSDVAYKARDREDLIAGIDEFLDEVIVLPPGEWDPKIRIEPPKKLPSPNGNAGGGAASAEDEDLPAPHELGEELKFTGRFCGGLWLDIKRKVPGFLSDFYEGFHIQSVSAVLFIYLGCITNAITFGGLLGDATDNYQGVMESFLGTALAGVVFCLFGGQPLIILSSTGPILIFEKLLYEFSINNDIDYMEIRLWIGLHSCLQCLILVATDASYIIKYMTRFTEEGFSSLISFIFISDALKKMMSIFNYYPINRDFKPDYLTSYRCDCQFNFSALDWNQLSKKECLSFGGSLVGKSCKYVPDLAMLSFILFFGTYSMTISLKKFKASRYFPTKLRKLISDFAIFMSIMTFVGLDLFMGLKTPKLIVPTEFKPTRPDRGWIVMPFGKNPWWMCLASFAPALLVTILIFMDQQITAVIVNRKENKLKYIPMPVLYGVFLYMGVASLHGIQFWERMKLFLMPAKHQPDFVFLRHVPLRRVHLFTLVQITCLAVLWILKSTVAAIIFPVMILGLMVVRKTLDLIFSQHDLAWLDDILPDKDKKKKEDEKKKKEKKKAKSEEHNNSDEEVRTTIIRCVRCS